MRIAVSEPYALASGVKFVEVSSLPAATRELIGQCDDKVALYLPHSRSAVRLIDKSLARLLAAFAVPVRISDAIIAFAREAGDEPVTVADLAYPFIRECILARLLTPTRGEPDDSSIHYSLAPGDLAHGMLVKRRIKLLRDTEVYELVSDGSALVLKTARPQCREEKRLHLRREAEVLALLPPGLGPALVRAGSREDIPCIIMEHVDGISIAERAMFLRRKGRVGLPDLLRLCRNLVEAYARLAAAGVLHGDVHPGNVLAASDGAVRLLDFGLSRMEGRADPADERGGVTYYMEPEWAVESLAARAPPRLTETGQVYAISQLLYELLCGRPPYERKLVLDEVLSQIATAPATPLPPLAGLRCDALAAVLERAMAKAPERRYQTVAALAAEFVRAAATVAVDGSDATHSLERKQSAWIDWLLTRAWIEADSAEPMRSRPSCSVMNGAAGVALALHRVACALDDGEVLALAQRWVAKAYRDLDTPEALHFDSLTPELIGRSTPYHTESGIHFAGAILASEQQDWPSFREFAARYAGAALLPCPNPDLTLGRAGALLGLSILIEHAEWGPAECRSELVDAGETLAAGLFEWVEQSGPLGEDPALQYSGLAHGLPGILYTLVGSPFAGADMAGAAEARLGELAGFAEQTGAGTRWPRALPRTGQPAYFPSWCNGNGGQVHFWLAMAERYGKAQYRDLAVRSGHNCWDEPAAGSTLCCGLGGQAYAFLALYAETGEAHWLGKAQAWAELAAGRDPIPTKQLDALYKGMTGVVALLADLKRPESAVMPLFGRFGRRVERPGPAGPARNDLPNGASHL
jgi:serine/threonine-protein kinase